MDKEVRKNLIKMSFEYNRNKAEEELEKMNIALGVLMDKIAGDTNKFFNVE